MWKSILKTVAPVLSTAIGGPFGGMAVKFLSDFLFDDENASEDEVLKAIENASPETLLKLKEADYNFKSKMKELNIKEQDLHVQDRNSARNLAKINMWPQISLSVIYVVAFAGILIIMLTTKIQLEPTQNNIVMILIGILSTGLVQIMNFWFGSSAGSKEKTAKMNVVKRSIEPFEDD